MELMAFSDGCSSEINTRQAACFAILEPSGVFLFTIRGNLGVRGMSPKAPLFGGPASSE
jgi:hypothetical protein